MQAQMRCGSHSPRAAISFFSSQSNPPAEWRVPVCMHSATEPRAPSPTAADTRPATFSAPEPAWLTNAAEVLRCSSPLPPRTPSPTEADRRRASSEQPGRVKPRRLSSDKLRATESTQHSLFALSWRASALLGAAALLALLLAVALFSGVIRFSGRCAVPPARVHATLTGLVERGLSQIELPIAAPSVQRQHHGPGIPYATAGTFNTSVHALHVGAIECAACYPDGRTFFDQIPPKVVVRLVDVNATASVRYEGYAALGELELELDLEQPGVGGKVTSCGGSFEAVAPAVTGQKSVDTSAVLSGVAQAICYGSSSDRGIGARADTSSAGLAGALGKEVRAALLELREAVQAEVDGTLLRLLVVTALLLAAGWACALPRTRKFTAESIRRVYAWVLELAQPYPAHRATVRPRGDTPPTAPREKAAARPPAAVRADGPHPNPETNPNPHPHHKPDPNPVPTLNRNRTPNANPSPNP